MPSKRLRTTLKRVLGGRSDANLSFGDVISLLLALGFEQRTRGNHHILWREGLSEIINLQPIGNKVKRYQVKQVRGILLKYGLEFEDE